VVERRAASGTRGGQRVAQEAGSDGESKKGVDSHESRDSRANGTGQLQLTRVIYQ